MFGRMIWDKFPERIFWIFEIARLKQGQFQNFQNTRGWFIPKIARVIYPNQTGGYWLITPNQQTPCVEDKFFQQRVLQISEWAKTAGNYKITLLIAQCWLQSTVWLVLVIKFLRGKFGINLPSSLFGNFEIFRVKRRRFQNLKKWPR